MKRWLERVRAMLGWPPRAQGSPRPPPRSSPVRIDPSWRGELLSPQERARIARETRRQQVDAAALLAEVGVVLDEREP